MDMPIPILSKTALLTFPLHHIQQLSQKGDDSTARRPVEMECMLPDRISSKKSLLPYVALSALPYN